DRGVHVLDQPEVHYFGHITNPAPPAKDDVGGLDVSVDEPHRMSLYQRRADLLQDVDDPPGRLGPARFHERLQVQPGEVLHGVVKNAIRGPAVVVNGNGIGMGQEACEQNLLLESRDALVSDLLRPQELYGGGTAEHRVARPVNLTHTPFTDLLLE